MGGRGPLLPALPPVAEAAAEDITWTLFLIGDAGEALPDDPVLSALTKLAAVAPDRSTIVFLGDNIYPAGMPDSSDATRARAEFRMGEQLEVFRRSNARGFFIPGNHDWSFHEREGFIAILRQAEFISANSNGLAELLPTDGCPGPAVRDVGDKFRLVFLDTQWFLHEHVKPDHPTSGCPADTDAEVTAALTSEIAGGNGREVLVFGHHPLASGGVHGGRSSLSDHLFPLRLARPWLWVPLPLVGSIYPIVRSSGVSRQDIANPRNREMRAALEAGMAAARPLAYVAGHEHNLQVVQWETARWLLVSGSGYFDHAGPTAWLETTRFAAAASGFMRIDALRSGQIRLAVIGLDRSRVAKEIFSMYLE